MIEALALDALLILILLLLIPIGLYRGGLREVCAAAGLLLGLLVAGEWSGRWGDWMAEAAGFDAGVSKFVVAIATMVLCAGVIGYGAAASFSYSPGPGGRMYGGLIALLTGVIFLGALIQFVSIYLYDDVLPDIIRDGYVSRALTVGFDWVLLAVAGAVLLATLFGTVVREREIGETTIDYAPERPQPARRVPTSTATAPEPVTLEPSASNEPANDVVGHTAAVKIREVRHWEEPKPPTMQELQSGWTRTWPSSVTGDAGKVAGSRRDPRTPRTGSSSAKKPGSPDEAVIRDWLANDQSPPGTRSQPRRPAEDE